MKPENTISNKSKFFAQYWGQKLYHYTDLDGEIFGPFKVGRMDVSEIDYILVTPLSSISDEDAKKLGYDSGVNFNEVNEEIYDMTPPEVDWLRSKGYALSWMGLSVEELVEYGWVKIKEE